MSHVTSIENLPNTASYKPLVKASLYMAYGLVSYAVGVAGLAIMVLGYAGILPVGQILPFTSTVYSALTVNALLLVVFGLQHSVMARPAFKAWLNRFLPEATQRSHFIWTSGVTIAAMVCLWQPLPGSAWQVHGLPATIFWIGFGIGWAYLLAATFAINHFDLFGLRQVWLAATGREYTPVAFKEHWMYRYSRHPIMLGVLIGIWAVPEMDITLLGMTIGITLYMAVGLYFEERDLIRSWGKHYLDYKKRVGLFFTFR